MSTGISQEFSGFGIGDDDENPEPEPEPVPKPLGKRKKSSAKKPAKPAKKDKKHYIRSFCDYLSVVRKPDVKRHILQNSFFAYNNAMPRSHMKEIQGKMDEIAKDYEAQGYKVYFHCDKLPVNVFATHHISAGYKTNASKKKKAINDDVSDDSSCCDEKDLRLLPDPSREPSREATPDEIPVKKAKKAKKE